MQELLRDYLGELRSKRRKRRRISVAVTLLIVMVAGGVIGALVQYGVAMTGDAKCGIEEHTHSDECYENVLACGQEESEGHTHTDACYQTNSTLACGLEESEEHVHGEECYVNEQVLICGQEEGEGHTHTDSCYDKQLACGKEEHIHTDACYIDATADVEESSDWDAQYKDTEWKDAWGEDLVTAAKVQVGYKESTKNYTVAADESHKGYTRYGQFAGDVYADWDAMFVNFCMHYAGLEDSNLFPNEKTAVEWYNKFVQVSETNLSYITAPEGYEPKVGDLIFFNKEEENEFRMGVVSSYNKEKNEIKVIEGDSENEVKENKYDADDEYIYAYLKITELETAYKDKGEEDSSAEVTEEPADGEEQDPQDEITEEEGDPQDEIAEEEEELQDEKTEEEEWAYEESYDADKVIVHVKAKEGVIPEGAELSVTPIEKKEITDDMSKKEKKEAEKVNEQYEMTSEKLSEESEKNEQKLEGFFAYDICFLVDGEEVEPDGEVKVTMDFKEAVVPEGVPKNAEIAVNHLKEDKNAEDGIKVENLTENDTTIITTSEEKVSVEKVELMTDSFSTYVITWLKPDASFATMQVIHAKASDRTPFDIGVGEPAVKDIEVGELYNLESQLNLDLILEEGVTYIPTSIEVARFDEQEWTATDSICQVSKVMIDSKNNLNFYSLNEGVEEKVFSCSEDEVYWNKYCLRVLYRPAQLEIVDEIKTTGNLTVDPQGYKAGQENGYQLPENAKYVWYKNVNGNGYEPVDEIPYGDGLSNLIGDFHESLNVALDNGSRSVEQWNVKYRVELKIDGVSVASSKPYSVSYYNYVRNGSFEQPLLNDTTPSFDKYVQENRMEGWRTTAYSPANENDNVQAGYYMEVANVVNGKINDLYQYKGNDFKAAEGKQFAEINSNATGSLYQDVLMVKGVPVNYSFSHRARSLNGNMNAKDRMYLLIVPTFVAEAGIKSSTPSEDGDVTPNPIDTQAEVVELIKHMDDTDKSGNLIYPGVYIQEYTAGVYDWEEHSGSYIPEYDLNRFFFVSANESTPHEGNFIDNVWCSQTLPEPIEGTFNFRIEKTISGLDKGMNIDALKEQIKNLKFTITITDELGNLITDLKDIDTGVVDAHQKMEWTKNGNGTYTGVKNYYNVEIPKGYENTKFTISVKEEGGTISPYVLDTKISRLIRDETGSEVEVDEKEISGTEWEVTVQKGYRGRLEFKNNYKTAEESYTWEMMKYSSSENGGPLPDAEFNLCDSSMQIIATGTSDSSGKITWEQNGTPLDVTTLSGVYTMSEKTAPSGFSCSTQSWKLKFENGVLDEKAFKDENSNKEIELTKDTGNKKYQIKIYNTPLYSLPSTGGSGVYWYMFSGILLMAGAALITYKKRCREVLRS